MEFTREDVWQAHRDSVLLQDPDRSEEDILARGNLPEGYRLYYTCDRAVRGTAEADMLYDVAASQPGRVAPVVSLPAGHRAQSECVRYMTIVRE